MVFNPLDIKRFCNNEIENIKSVKSHKTYDLSKLLEHNIIIANNKVRFKLVIDRENSKIKSIKSFGQKIRINANDVSELHFLSYGVYKKWTSNIVINYINNLSMLSMLKVNNGGHISDDNFLKIRDEFNEEYVEEDFILETSDFKNQTKIFHNVIKLDCNYGEVVDIELPLNPFINIIAISYRQFEKIGYLQ